jgi:hypothetical protein
MLENDLLKEEDYDYEKKTYFGSIDVINARGAGDRMRKQ